MNTLWAKYSGKIVENTLEKPIGKRLSKKQIWIFAIGQLGWSILGGIVNAWLVTFYFPTGDDIAAGAIQYIPTGHIFWVLTVLGIITAASRLFDAVTDPLIASLSDRCKSKRGRRIPFMQWSAVPFAAVAVLLFCAPDKFISSGNIAWISVFVILFSSILSMYMFVKYKPYTSNCSPHFLHTRTFLPSTTACLILVGFSQAGHTTITLDESNGASFLIKPP